jgi:hypothetical protein
MPSFDALMTPRECLAPGRVFSNRPCFGILVTEMDFIPAYQREKTVSDSLAVSVSGCIELCNGKGDHQQISHVPSLPTNVIERCRAVSTICQPVWSVRKTL